MGDYTYFQGKVIASDEEAVAEVMDEYGVIQNEDEGPRWFAEEMRCGSTEEIAAALIEADPLVRFYIWEDPKYEWLGSLAAFTPELGLFEHDCDSEGNAVFSAKEVVSIIGAGNQPTEADILACLGLPWTEALYGA